MKKILYFIKSERNVENLSLIIKNEEIDVEDCNPDLPILDTKSLKVPSEQKCDICNEFFEDLDIHFANSHIKQENQSYEDIVTFPEVNVENPEKIQDIKNENLTEDPLKIESQTSRISKIPKLQTKSVDEGPKNFQINKFESIDNNFIETEEVKHKCDICGKCLSTVDSVKKHKIKIHKTQVDTKPKNFKCDQCDKSFINTGFLARHKHNVHESNSFKFPCKFCDKKYSNEELLSIHISNVHECHNTQKVACTKCGKDFRGSNLTMAKSLLRNHMFSVHSM